MGEPLPQMRAITFIQVSIHAAKVLNREEIYYVLDRFRLGLWGELDPTTRAYNAACLRSLAPIAIAYDVGALTVIVYADFETGTARIGISPEEVRPEEVAIVTL